MRHAYEVSEIADGAFEDWWQSCLRCAEASSRADHISIGVDVSCFNRFKIAAIFDGIRNLGATKKVNVDFWYSLAQFSPPTHDIVGNRHVGPIHPSFAGWFPDVERPVVAVVGLGYEQDKALGAIEHLQVDQAWTYTPSSPIAEYKPAVLSANDILLKAIPSVRSFEYLLDRPLETITNLQSLCATLVADHNIVMLPFGPKLFVVECLIVATVIPTLSVWRVSAGADASPVQRLPSEHIFSCRVEWRPTMPS